MSRKRQIITLPFDLILDDRISSNAKVIYAVLNTFPKDTVRAASSSASSAAAVIVTHREITGRTNLSLHTVTKSLARLELIGWILQQRSSGSANRYVFTTPVQEK